MAKMIDNQKSMSLVLKKKEKKTNANKPNDNLGDGNITAGDEVTFGALVDGVEIQGDFLNANWTIIGNVQMYTSIVYTAEDGDTTAAEPKSYPLDGFILPKTPAPSQVFQISLTGEVVDPPIPEFYAMSFFVLVGPGYAPQPAPTVYGTEIAVQLNKIDPTDKKAKTFVGMIQPGVGEGIQMPLNFNSNVGNGNIFAISLVDGDCWWKYGTQAEQYPIVDTEGDYIFDGSDYPFVEQAITAPGPAQVLFDDDPGVFIEDGAKVAGSTWHWNTQFLTYFFFQASDDGSCPVPIGFPVMWGLQWDASYDGTNFTITNPLITPPEPVQEMEMPVWAGFTPNDESKKVSRAIPKRDKQPLVPKQISSKRGWRSPSDAARSTFITFQNTSNAYLTLQTAHLDHGIWSEGYLPPQNVAPGTTSNPTTVQFGAESQGSTTGDEGYVQFVMQDGLTTIKLYFDNPYWGSNGYSVSINGPLGGQYSGTYSGGSGDNADWNVYLAPASSSSQELAIRGARKHLVSKKVARAESTKTAR